MNQFNKLNFFKMRINNLTLFFIFIFISCNNKNTQLELTDIKLELKEGKYTFFEPIENTLQFLSQHSRYPKYYQDLYNNSGFKRKDSLIISFLRTNYNSHIFNLYKKGYIGKEEFISYSIDSLDYQNTPIDSELLVGIQFKNNSQILFVDENKNGNFKDEKPIIFKSDFRNHNSDSADLKDIPEINFNYWIEEEGIITRFKRKVIVYPSLKDYRFSKTDDEISKKSRLLLKFKDYWEGKAVFDDIEYVFVVQGRFKSNFSLYIKPETQNFDSKNVSINQNFKYEIKDSIKLGNKIFVLENISNDLTNLKIKEIKGKDFIYGNKVGQKLKNFELETLTSKKEKLANILNKKKYTIIDFWGTWCKPCREQIPILKEFYNKNKDQINMISIAYDKNLDNVIQYTNKNEMNWSQYFYDRNVGTGIIDDLRIIFYPTLLLVDNEMNILYKESGTSNFDELNHFLNQNK
jgi:thiol-disulfide isomerase/thioredoxin